MLIFILYISNSNSLFYHRPFWLGFRMSANAFDWRIPLHAWLVMANRLLLLAARPHATFYTATECTGIDHCFNISQVFSFATLPCKLPKLNMWEIYAPKFREWIPNDYWFTMEWAKIYWDKVVFFHRQHCLTGSLRGKEYRYKVVYLLLNCSVVPL